MNSPFGGPAGVSEVYFIGIGGIGMSALARFFHQQGAKVSGYDKTPTALTKQLEAEGIAVHYSEDLSRIPQRPGFVVYTPAIPATHQELVYYRATDVPVLKRSDVLEKITAGSFNICVAGTHGKTTITTMVAHLLRHSGNGGNAFLGGISVNYGTNFWSGGNNCCIVEADEYDRSFLKLFPDIAVITAMDADHLDIYGSVEAMEDAFIAFSRNIRPGGLLIRRFGLKRGRELQAPHQYTYSLQNESADLHAANIRMEDGGYVFDVNLKDDRLENVRLNMGGMHNVENAVVAIAVASSLKIEKEKIREAVAAFRGVKRRFEYVIRNPRLVLIDDYAHHPEELRALIQGARSLFPQRKCTVIFQPHLFSRTRDLAKGFANALDEADETILLPIYPAREEPIPGVTSELITAAMDAPHKKVVAREELLNWIRNEYAPSLDPEFGDLLIMAGAGDIDMLVEPAGKILNERL